MTLPAKPELEIKLPDGLAGDMADRVEDLLVKAYTAGVEHGSAATLRRLVGAAESDQHVVCYCETCQDLQVISNALLFRSIRHTETPLRPEGAESAMVGDIVYSHAYDLGVRDGAARVRDSHKNRMMELVASSEHLDGQCQCSDCWFLRELWGKLVERMG